MDNSIATSSVAVDMLCKMSSRVFINVWCLLITALQGDDVASISATSHNLAISIPLINVLPAIGYMPAITIKLCMKIL